MGYEKQSCILVPLHKHGKVVGVLAMSCTDLCEYFTHSVENLALHISTALELANKHAQRNRALQALKRYHGHLGELVEERTGELKTVNEKLLEEITERKQADEALQAEKNKLQSLIGAMEYTLTIQDAGYNIIYQNELSRTASGGDHLGEKCYRAYEGRGKICDGCPVEKAFKDGESHTAERKTVTPSGEVAFWENTANPIRDAGGRVVSCLELARNITERKRMEEALADEVTRRRLLVDQSLDGIVVLDENAKVYESNQRFAEMLGYTPEEVRELHTWDWDKNFPPEKLLEMGRAVDEKGLHLETQHHRKDGSVIDVDISINGAMCGGQKLIFCVCRDITERKRAEEAVRESEEKLQKMFESVTDAISVVDLNGVIIEANQRTVEMHGFTSKDELLGKKALEMVAPRDRERIAANMRKAIKEGAIRGVEYTLPRADGTEFPGELSTSVLRDASGKPVAHITIARDITERKRMEEALRESEERFRSIVENSQTGIMILDDAYRFVYVNDKLLQISGYSREETIGQDFRRFLDEESRQLVADRYIRRQRGEEVPSRYEFNIVRKDGQKRRVEISSAVIRDSAGKVRTLAQILDITERKQTEEALQAEKNKLQSIMDAMEDHLTIRDKDYNLIYQGEPSRKIFGDHVGEKCYRVYADREEICEGCPVEEAFKDGKSHVAERRTVAPSGEVIFWENTANPIRDARGNIASCLEIGRNITERKQAEEALRESQEFSSSLLESSPNPIFVINPDTSVRYVNPAFEKLTGFTLAEIVGVKAPHPWWPEEQREKMATGLKETMARGGKRSERNFQKKNGERFWVEMNSAAVMQDGKPAYFLLNWLDITKRKQAEEALDLQRAYFQQLFDNSPDAIALLDKAGGVVQVNKGFEALFGYQAEEAKGQHIVDIIVPKDLLEETKALTKAALSGKAVRLETVRRRKDGSLVDVSLVRYPIRFSGEVIGTYFIYTDITERKQAEERLKLLSSVTQQVSDATLVTDLDFNITYVNKAAEDLFGYSAEEMRGKHMDFFNVKISIPEYETGGGAGCFLRWTLGRDSGKKTKGRQHFS